MSPTRISLHATPATATWTTARDDDLARRRRSTTALVAQILGGPPVVELTSSCTHALEAAATILGIGPGDEVIVPAYAFPSTANAFVLRGARIRFADVSMETGNVQADDVERLLGPRTRAVVCVHYGGVACEMERLTPLAESHDVDLVEDAAHGLFATLNGTPLGRLGRVGCLSFHRTKNISAVEGGALILNDPTLRSAADVALDKGTNRADFEAGVVDSYEWSGPGSAWRLPDPLVAHLAQQLARSDEIQARRHRVWTMYWHRLADWADRIGAGLPVVPQGREHPAHLFWIRLPERVGRDGFVEWCAVRGIQTARHYTSLRDSVFGRSIAGNDDVCPNAAVLAQRVVRLPLHHELTDADVDRVVDAVTSTPT